MKALLGKEWTFETLCWNSSETCIARIIMTIRKTTVVRAIRLRMSGDTVKV